MIRHSANMLSCMPSYAGAIFADACLKGLNGVPDVVECSYVQLNVTELPFFASKIAGWLSHFKWGSPSCMKSDRQIDKSLKSLCVLNLRILVPYLVEKSKCDILLAELYLDNCELSCQGASQLLKVLSALNVPLKSLLIGDNHLTSKFGPSLGKFL